MTIENVPMFDVVDLKDITIKHIKDAIEDSVNPQTGEYDETLEDFGYDDLHDPWRNEVVPGIGTFKAVTSWCGGDGHEQGGVVQHLESGKYFMVLGTYSSWDASDWDRVVEATPYEFIETRYKAV